MATITHNDESLVEKDEFFYLNANMIDNEPFYKNFTTIQNVLQHCDEQKQINTSIYSTDDKHEIELSSNSDYPSNELNDINHQNSSKTIDECIFNLIQIVEDIGYNPKLPFIHSFQNNNNNSSYLNILSKLGGTHKSYVNIWRSHTDEKYFQRWYLEKYQRSASMIQYNQVNHINEKTTQISDDYQSNSVSHSSVLTKLTSKLMDEKHFKKEIQQMYGFDDVDTISSTSSRPSSVDEKNFSSDQQQLSSTPILETNDNLKPKQITIREYYPSKEIPLVMVNRSLSSSSQQTIDDIDYEQFIQNHPELNNDPNPEIITKPNPDQVTYKQNVSIRYLVPPTPPPPGPLIIREIIPPRPPTPPPLVIKQQDPSPATPPPLILREAPPPLPPHQEAQVITKVLPQEPPSSQRVIFERNAPLPPKPQSIIIEKWLPYKPAPPREVIYERITEAPIVSEFQPNGITIDRQRHHSADFNSKSSSRLPIPVHIEQQNSFDHLENKQSSVFNQFAWSTQQQLQTLQHRAIEQMQAHQQWIANQHQRHMNMFMRIPSQLTTPTLIINHPPVTKTTSSYVHREAFQEQVLYEPTVIYPSYV